MKHIFNIIVLLLGSLTLVSQNNNVETTYIVKFKNKGENISLIYQPELYLSKAAIERRNNQNINIDELDLPICKSFLNTIEKKGAKVLHTSKWLNIAIVSSLTTDTYKSLQELPFVYEVVRRDFFSIKSSNIDKFELENNIIKNKTHQLLSSTNNIFDYGNAANQIEMIKINEVHNNGYTGKDIVVAVLDAGFRNVDVITAFDSLRANNQILSTIDFVNPGANIYDNNISSHGTSVLSTIAANLPGIMVGSAPKAKFHLIRTEDARNEYLMEEFFWVKGAEYADSVGAQVINSSLGYIHFDNTEDDHAYSDLNGNTTIVTIGADIAAKKGIFVVNSAGNNGNNIFFYIGAPADGDSVFSIGAVDSEGNRASFSSQGPTFDGRIKPDVMAQGEATALISGNGEAVYGNGTSFSSPIIAGAVACLRQYNNKINNYDLMNIIKQNSSLSDNPNNLMGYGIPDFFKTFKFLKTNIINENNNVIAPNPFINYISLRFTDNAINNKKAVVNIYSTDSKLIYSKNLYCNNNILIVNELEFIKKGLYILNIAIDGSTYNFKICK